MVTLAALVADVEQIQDVYWLFPNPLLFSFTSDSPSVMALLRMKALELPNFNVAFGCTPHNLNNFTLDIFKKCDILKTSIHETIYLVKTIYNTHLLFSLYDILYKKKLGIAYVLIIFIKSRLTTSLYIYVWLN